MKKIDRCAYVNENVPEAWTTRSCRGLLPSRTLTANDVAKTTAYMSDSTVSPIRTLVQDCWIERTRVAEIFETVAVEKASSPGDWITGVPCATEGRVLCIIFRIGPDFVKLE
jgi:hypothetical protein